MSKNSNLNFKLDYKNSKLITIFEANSKRIPPV